MFEQSTYCNHVIFWSWCLITTALVTRSANRSLYQGFKRLGYFVLSSLIKLFYILQQHKPSKLAFSRLHIADRALLTFINQF